MMPTALYNITRWLTILFLFFSRDVADFTARGNTSYDSVNTRYYCNDNR